MILIWDLCARKGKFLDRKRDKYIVASDWKAFGDLRRNFCSIWLNFSYSIILKASKWTSKSGKFGLSLRFSQRHIWGGFKFCYEMCFWVRRSLRILFHFNWCKLIALEALKFLTIMTCLFKFFHQPQKINLSVELPSVSSNKTPVQIPQLRKGPSCPTICHLCWCGKQFSLELKSTIQHSEFIEQTLSYFNWNYDKFVISFCLKTLKTYVMLRQFFGW